MPAAPKKTSNIKKKVVKKPKTPPKAVAKVVAKAVAKVEEPKVEEPKVEVAPTTDITAPVDTVSQYADEFTHLISQLRTLQTTLKELTTYTQKLEKRVSKEQKAVQKRVNGKRRRAPGSSQPSGFSKPGPVSDEMRAFLKIGKDDLIARTQCTKRINAYCKEHGLQGVKDKRILNADKTLRKLLRLGVKDELTFFNLQKYMKIHFPNKEGVYPTA